MIDLVIFDLDDVLFPEKEYILSGFHSVAKILVNESEKQQKLENLMMQFFEIDKRHVFNMLAEKISKSIDEQKKLILKMIEIYRNHKPNIHLYNDVISILNNLHNKGIRTAILTDGRAASQELKINALGLTDKVDKIVLTDLLGPNRVYWKPHSYGFKILLDYFSIKPNQACYIADNVSKDFHGPNDLGMRSILLKRDDGLYSHLINNEHSKKFNYIPKNKISSLNSLLELLPKL